MQNHNTLSQPRSRILAGAATFAITAAIVMVMALMLSKLGGIQPASPGSLTPMQTAINTAFGDPAVVTLEGYSLEAADLAAGDQIDLTLRWHTHQQIDDSLLIFVQIIGADGMILASADAKPKYMAQDAMLDQRFNIPSANLAGSYQIQIEVRDAVTNIVIGSAFQLPQAITVAAPKQIAAATRTPAPTIAPTAIAEQPTEEALNTVAQVTVAQDTEQSGSSSAPAADPANLPISAAPAIPANSTGGFSMGATDVSGLPSYTLPFGGSGSGGGSGWCAANPNGSGYLRDTSYDEKELCIYDLPASAPIPATVTVTLTSPSGRSYSHNFTVNKNAGTVMAEGYNPSVIALTPGGIDASMARTPFVVWVHFPAAQEHGAWSFSACVAPCGQAFASGSLSVVPSGPIYSITRASDALDPFSLPSQIAAINMYWAGEQLVIAGKGYQPNQTMTLALYGDDPSYIDDDTVRRIAYYAAQVTTNASGEFSVGFTVGNQTGMIFTVHFNPQAGAYNPAPVMMQVGW